MYMPIRWVMVGTCIFLIFQPENRCFERTMKNQLNEISRSSFHDVVQVINKSNLAFSNMSSQHPKKGFIFLTPVNHLLLPLQTGILCDL